MCVIGVNDGTSPVGDVPSMILILLNLQRQSPTIFFSRKDNHMYTSRLGQHQDYANEGQFCFQLHYSNWRHCCLRTIQHGLFK